MAKEKEKRSTKRFSFSFLKFQERLSGFFCLF
jgi:hypothetical protein